MEWWDYLIIAIVIAVVLTICVTIAVAYHRSEKAYNSKVAFSRMSSMVTKKNGFLSEKEYAFFKVLNGVSSSLGYVAFPKVCVGSLVNCRTEKKSKHETLHSIVDFCLFSSNDFSPVLVIDIFDNTLGDQSLLAEMDKFIVRAVRYSGIPILKINYNDAMEADSLRKAIIDEIAIFEKNILFKEKEDGSKKETKHK